MSDQHSHNAAAAAGLGAAATGAPTPRTLDLKGGRQGVLLLHGLSSGPQELQFLARGLQRAGYTVRVPVIDGYSFGAGGQGLQGHAQWAAAALAEFDALRAQCDSVAVGGLCIGAVLALRIAALRSPMTAAVLALSTTLHYDGWAAPWTRRFLPLATLPGLGPLARRIAVRESAPFGVKDERMRGWIAAQMREAGTSDAGAAVLTVRDLSQAQRLINDVRRRLPDINAPVLLLHAREDDAASPRSAFEVAQRVASPHVRCVLLADSYHMISIDREKHRVLGEMKDFLSHHHPVASARKDGIADNLVPFDRASAPRRTP
jgi:carboxylesterase